MKMEKEDSASAKDVLILPEQGHVSKVAVHFREGEDFEFAEKLQQTEISDHLSRNRQQHKDGVSARLLQQKEHLLEQRERMRQIKKKKRDEEADKRLAELYALRSEVRSPALQDLEIANGDQKVLLKETEKQALDESTEDRTIAQEMQDHEIALLLQERETKTTSDTRDDKDDDLKLAQECQDEEIARLLQSREKRLARARRQSDSAALQRHERTPARFNSTPVSKRNKDQDYLEPLQVPRNLETSPVNMDTAPRQKAPPLPPKKNSVLLSELFKK